MFYKLLSKPLNLSCIGEAFQHVLSHRSQEDGLEAGACPECQESTPDNVSGVRRTERFQKINRSSDQEAIERMFAVTLVIYNKVIRTGYIVKMNKAIYIVI